MTGSGGRTEHPELIRDSGAILRTLAPARVATLIFIREDDISQLEIAERLGRTSGAISNYIETLMNLPHPLIGKDGHDYWATSEGKQVVSAIYRFAGNLDIDLPPEWSEETGKDLGHGLSPLYEFRSDPPFYVLYALGVDSPSRLAVRENLQPTHLSEVVDIVKEWLDESITRRQVRDRVLKFERAGSVTIEEQSITMTEKGIEQCRLLEQIAQVSADESIVEEESEINVLYHSEDGTTLPLPSSITPSELEDLAVRFRDEHGDIQLDLTPIN